MQRSSPSALTRIGRVNLSSIKWFWFWCLVDPVHLKAQEETNRYATLPAGRNHETQDYSTESAPETIRSVLSTVITS